MVEVSDITLNESKGDYSETCRIMATDLVDEWMIRSSLFISNPFIAVDYIAHFWHDGKVVIYDADRPFKLGTSDEDIRELKEWCVNNGWKSLGVNDRLLIDRVAHEFWYRIYQSGLVENEELKKKDDIEMERFSQAYMKEKEEDNGLEEIK